MSLAARILTGLLALIGVGTGAKSIFFGLAESNAAALLDNGHRFYAGIWLGVGLSLLYCAVRWKSEDVTLLFRASMLAIMVGGVARAVGLLHYGAEPPMLVAIAIEWVVPVVAIALESRKPRTA